MQGIEQELKWALEPDGHAVLAARLAAALGPPHQLEQRNRFLDSADRRLLRARLNLRLRAEDGGTLLTVKGRLGEPGPDGLHRQREWERRLDAGAFAADPAEVAGWELPAELGVALSGAPLVDLGGFANARLEWRSGGDLLCLDATALPHRTDHELEIETADPTAAARWGRRLAEWGVWYEPQPLTKFARFLRCGAPGRTVRVPAVEGWCVLLERWSGGRLACRADGPCDAVVAAAEATAGQGRVPTVPLPPGDDARRARAVLRALERAGL